MGRTLINTLTEPKGDHPPLGEAGCGGSCGAPPRAAARLGFDAPPVRVDGVLIPEAEIAREVQHHGGASIEEARAAAARALVIRHLLLQRARALSLTPMPEQDALGRWESDEESLVRQVLEIEAQPIAPTEDECRRVHEGSRGALPESFDDARPLVRDRLMARAWMTAAVKYVARLWRAARIEGVSILEGDGP